MKKFTLILTLVVSLSAFSQFPSTLRPILVVWSADGQNVSLRKALYGVNVPQRLSLQVYFLKSDISRYAGQNLKLEFRWYYYLSTRKKIVKTEVVSFQDAMITPDGAVIFKSTLNTVQPGWWEVQIISSIDRQPITYGRLNKFQIFVRRQMLVKR